jgi:hypothetical protein
LEKNYGSDIDDDYYYKNDLIIIIIIIIIVTGGSRCDRPILLYIIFVLSFVLELSI